MCAYTCANKLELYLLSSFFYIQRGAAPPENNQVQLEQSLRELRILNSCRHDNILPLFGFSVGGDEPCLVYQFMPNGSLEDRLLCRVVIVISIMYQNQKYFIECFVIIKLSRWQDEEIAFGRYTLVVFIFPDVFYAVMRMLMALRFVYCEYKFVPVKCHSTYCSDRSFFHVFYKV